MIPYGVGRTYTRLPETGISVADMLHTLDEPDLDPSELFVQLGTLVIEGRCPSSASPRGSVEGVHCLPPTGPLKPHVCDVSDPKCGAYDGLRQHMLMLWRNGLPMCVEVLLQSDCCCSSAQPASEFPLRFSIENKDLGSHASSSGILLEQWTIHMIPRRLQENSVPNSRALLQAVRSFLHFSQLSAWFSVSNGKRPANVHYRICVTGEAFSNKFLQPPESHVFPTAVAGRSLSVRVTVNSLPRCGERPPASPCPHVSSPNDLPSDSDPAALIKLSPTRRERSGSFSLGDSLLDPPHLLDMYPKRYQSPSRSVSPVVETPEHLLRGSRSRSSSRQPCPARYISPVSVKPNNRKLPTETESEEPQTNEVKRPNPRTSAKYEQTIEDDDGTELVDENPLIIPSGPAPPPSSLRNSPDGVSEKKQRERERMLAAQEKLCRGLWNGRLPPRDDDRRNAVVKERRAESDEAVDVLNQQNVSQGVQVEMASPEEMSPRCRCSVTPSKKEVPSAQDKAKFRRSLDSATNLVYHSKSGIPLMSSPAPVRKGTRFDFDSTLTTISAIRSALYDQDQTSDEEDSLTVHSSSLAKQPVTPSNDNSLLGNFEESVLNGRLEPMSTVEGFTAEIGASGSFCPSHITLPVTVFYYTLPDNDKAPAPYLAHINLGKKGYHVPKKGTVQVTLFNPHGTVVKMFVVMYDQSDMPVTCHTFLRQRTLYMPVGSTQQHPDAHKWIRYLIHLRFASSKSGRIYLHTDIRMVIFCKSDMDAATLHQGFVAHELRSFTRGPLNPKFSPKR